MKKCPKCGNPSYDGAPVCGNCGYNFPKPKVKAPKEESVFQERPKVKKDGDNESTLEIIKANKLKIGIILLITLIVIFGIVLTSTGNNNSKSPVVPTSGLIKYSEGDFAFQYPNTWNETNLTDEEHPGAKFFEDNNGTVIEYYNVTSDSPSLKEITQQRISNALDKGSYIDLVETITMDGRNTSNIIFENADGDYTRYVSMLSDKDLYVFKITGSSENSVTSDEITSMLNTADIT